MAEQSFSPWKGNIFTDNINRLGDHSQMSCGKVMKITGQQFSDSLMPRWFCHVQMTNKCLLQTMYVGQHEKTSIYLDVYQNKLLYMY